MASPSHSSVPPLLRPFYEFLFPPACFACGCSLDVREHMVCDRCWSTVRRVEERDALYRETSGRISAPGVITDLVAAFYFEKDGVLQTLLHQLKYQGLTRLGCMLGEHLGKRIMRQLTDLDSASLVPVPLHRAKERERGYNQSVWICKGISAVTGLPPETNLLRRVRYTRSQTGLHVVERIKNVGGAFTLHPRGAKDLTGRTFLLVDDVVTTGSTLEACAMVLAAHGAHKVVACTVALAP